MELWLILFLTGLGLVGLEFVLPMMFWMPLGLAALATAQSAILLIIGQYWEFGQYSVWSCLSGSRNRSAVQISKSINLG